MTNDLARIQAALQHLRRVAQERPLKPHEMALANRLVQTERLLIAAWNLENARA